MAPGSFTLLHPFAATASPVNLISLKPSAGQGAELGVKTVTVSAVPVGPGGVLVPQKPASPQTTTTRPSPPPPGSKVTLVPTPCPPVDRISPAPELACNPGDLDVICVDNKMRRVTMETVGMAEQLADAVEISSGSEAESTSTFGDETDGDKDRETTSEMQRRIHNVMEKKRRVRLHRLFERLRTTVGLSDITSKHSMLKKAVQVIQVLTRVEAGLEEQKKRLMARRSKLLKAVMRCDTSRQEVPSVALETVVEKSHLIAAQRKLASVDFLSDHHEQQSRSSVKKMDDAQSITAAIETLCSALNNRNCPKRRQLKQVQQDIWTEQNNEERLKSLKTCLSQQRDTYVREICQRSGKSEQSILSELRHLSSSQRTAEEPHQAVASRALDDIIITSSDLSQAPPTLTPVHQAQSSPQVTLPVSHNASCMLGDRPRTVPNILSRRKKQAPPMTPPETTAESLALSSVCYSDSLLQQHHHLVPEAPPHQVDSAGSDQIKDQRPSHTGADFQSAEVMVGGAPDSECLTSLLNEIVFLNQQVVTTTATTGVPSPQRPSSEVGPQDEGHAHSPWLLQLDSDSDDTITMETVEAGLNDGPQPANENTTSGVLAPPPLLQMKVGGAKVADPASNHGATEEGVGGTTWRPMPRLVPLGLRGNPAS